MKYLTLPLYCNLYSRYAALFHLQNLKRQILIFELLVDAREVAFEFQQQTGKSICITSLLEIVIIEVEDAAEVNNLRLTLKDIGVIVELNIAVVFLIILIAYLAHNLFKNILKSYDAAGAAELVNNDGDMNPRSRSSIFFVSGTK